MSQQQNNSDASYENTNVNKNIKLINESFNNLPIIDNNGENQVDINDQWEIINAFFD